MTDADEMEHRPSDDPGPKAVVTDRGLTPDPAPTDTASRLIKAGVALFAFLMIAIGVGGWVLGSVACYAYSADCAGDKYIPISAILLAVLVIVAGRAALAGNRIGLIVVGLAGLASITLALAIGRLAPGGLSWLGAAIVFVAVSTGVMLLTGATGQNTGTTLPRRSVLLGLAVVISASAYFWVFEGGRSICPATLPAGLPAGLTWATHDKDVCISTDTAGSRRIYRGRGSDVYTGLMWSPDGETLAVEEYDSHVFVSISGEVRDGAEPEPQWYADRPIGYDPEQPILSPNGKLVAVYRFYHGLFMGASGSQADLRYITDDASDLSWSPDGEWLAFDKRMVWPSEVGRVFVVRSDGTLLTELAVRAGSPVWRP